MSPHRRDLADVAALKALAHPLRQLMLARLQQRGPATSAILAAELREDRGATSYHLRQLCRFGFIERDDARSAGRRKYWRAVPLDLRLPRRAGGGEAALVAGEISRQWHSRAGRLLAEFQSTVDAFGEFGAAAMSSVGGTTLTAPELARFTEEFMALRQRWQREPDAALTGARHISVIFHAFPTPDGIART